MVTRHWRGDGANTFRRARRKVKRPRESRTTPGIPSLAARVLPFGTLYELDDGQQRMR